MTRYIDTIRRLYIKNELNSNKGRKILETKARVFKISNEDAKKLEEEIIEKYNRLEEFAVTLIEANDEFELYEEDKQEVYEFALELGLTEEDANFIIKKFEDEIEDCESHIENVKCNIEIEQKQKCNDEKNSSEQIKNGLCTEEISGIEITYFSNFDEYKNIAYVNEVIEKSYLEFSQRLCKIPSRLNFTYEKVFGIYSETVIEGIKELQIYLLNEDLIVDTIDIDTMINFLCRIDFIKEFCEAIEVINTQASINMNIASAMNSTGSGNSMIFGNVATVVTYNTIAGVFNGVRDEIKSSKFKSKIDQAVYPIIIEGASQLVSMLLKETIEKFNYMKGIGAYKGSVDIEKLNENKREVESILSNLNRRTKAISKEEEIDKLKYVISKYPFKGDIFKRLLKLIGNDKENKIKVLGLSYKLLSNLTEFNEINQIYISEMTELYIREANNIKNEKDNNIIISKLNKIREKNNLHDSNIIANVECDIFGKIITKIDVTDLSEDTKVGMYSYFLENNKNREISKLAKELEEFMDKYQITSYYYNYDLDIIGTLVCANIKDKTFDERVEALKRGYETIRKRTCDNETKALIARNLRNAVNIDDEKCFAIEKSIIGSIISATEKEKTDIQLVDNILNLYSSIDKKLFGNNFKCCIEEDFNTGRILSNVEQQIKDISDKILFVNYESTLVFTPKNGFVIGAKSIYSSKWNTILKYSDILSIDYTVESFVDSSGDILELPSIKINTLGNKKYELETFYIQEVDFLTAFIHQIIKFTNNKIKLIDNANSMVEVIFEKNIHITRDGQKVDKYNAIELSSLIDTLQEYESTFIWMKGQDEWITLGQFIIDNNIKVENEKKENISLNEKDIYLIENGVQSGPYKLNSIFKRPIDTETTYMWYEGLSDWITVSEFITNA